MTSQRFAPYAAVFAAGAAAAVAALANQERIRRTATGICGAARERWQAESERLRKEAEAARRDFDQEWTEARGAAEQWGRHASDWAREAAAAVAELAEGVAAGLREFAGDDGAAAGPAGDDPEAAIKVDDVEGMPPEAAEALRLAGHATLADVRRAGLEAVSGLRGVGLKAIRALEAALDGPGRRA